YAFADGAPAPGLAALSQPRAQWPMAGQECRRAEVEPLGTDEDHLPVSIRSGAVGGICCAWNNPLMHEKCRKAGKRELPSNRSSCFPEFFAHGSWFATFAGGKLTCHEIGRPSR